MATKALNRCISEYKIIKNQNKSIILTTTLNKSNPQVPYVFVPSKTALGRACGVSRAVVACSVTTNDGSELAVQIRSIKNEIEKLLI